jgi:hypothetical protein
VQYYLVWSLVVLLKFVWYEYDASTSNLVTPFMPSSIHRNSCHILAGFACTEDSLPMDIKDWIADIYQVPDAFMDTMDVRL